MAGGKRARERSPRMGGRTDFAPWKGQERGETTARPNPASAGFLRAPFQGAGPFWACCPGATLAEGERSPRLFSRVPPGPRARRASCEKSGEPRPRSWNGLNRYGRIGPRAGENGDALVQQYGCTGDWPRSGQSKIQNAKSKTVRSVSSTATGRRVTTAGGVRGARRGPVDHHRAADSDRDGRAARGGSARGDGDLVLPYSALGLSGRAADPDVLFQDSQVAGAVVRHHDGGVMRAAFTA